MQFVLISGRWLGEFVNLLESCTLLWSRLQYSIDKVHGNMYEYLIHILR